jgi:tRNA(adenine34) deaminase
MPPRLFFDGTYMPASNLHTNFMHQAMALAHKAIEMDEVPVGALVVHNGKVIAEAHNLRETDQDPTAHAELLAMQMAAKVLGSWRLEDCTVYVTLEPCAMCAGAMVLSRIATCVYAAPDPRGGFLGTLGDLSQHPVLNHHFEVVDGVLADESSELLKGFFRDKRKKRRKD